MHHFLLLLFLACGGARVVGAETRTDDFGADPATRGWKVQGDPSLFRWQQESGQLAVTWDSSKPNSYFYRSLGTILSREDDFSFEFRIRLADIAIGTTAEKPYTFQIAAGLINLESATSTNFLRGSGLNNLTGPKNLIEFGYFPDSGFGATIALVGVSTNNRFAYAHYFPLELETNDWFHVFVQYIAANHELQTTMTRNGQPFGPGPNGQFPPLSLAVLPDFRVDAISFSSYSDVGQNPPEFSGSILAHGWIDDISLTVPPPPLRQVELVANVFPPALQFEGRTGWVYRSERTVDLTNWLTVSPAVPGNNALIVLTDTNGLPPSTAFYRVRATRP